jgi:hypothetical protein
MRAFTTALLLLWSHTYDGAPDTFTGVIADSECAQGNHATMRMGPTDAACVKACVEAHGASYVLYDGTRPYALSDQRAPQAFAGAKVTVTGTLDSSGKVIQVESMTPAPEAERDRASAEGRDRRVTRRAGGGAPRAEIASRDRKLAPGVHHPCKPSPR